MFCFFSRKPERKIEKTGARDGPKYRKPVPALHMNRGRVLLPATLGLRDPSAELCCSPFVSRARTGCNPREISARFDDTSTAFSRDRASANGHVRGTARAPWIVSTLRFGATRALCSVSVHVV
jgi:hypothetical protein